MPITIHPVSRRRFLAGTIAAGLGTVTLPEFLMAAEVANDPHRIALLSDIHIAADPAAHERGVAMAEHLKKAVAEIEKLDPKPAAAYINGDCAYHNGLSEDYQTLVKLLQPLSEGGLPIHLEMGNHDNREHLWSTIPHSEARVEPLANRQIMILEFPRANFFLLDSLDKTNHTPGVLGDAQIRWLAQALDGRKDKPALVFIHHQPDTRDKIEGLTDTKPLLDTLLPRRQVKALFYGHTHVWEVAKREDLHCVNLPAVAYVFQPGQPSGWVDAHLQENGMTLELRCIDPTHPKHGDKVELTWRA
ncbi:MAG TPA: metallophosphoesterase [Tepidisphaeraceae bacterium]|jgi:3',5'-cyclic AMP phosphodiesterase CpdA